MMEQAELPQGWAIAALGDVIHKARPKIPADPNSQLPFIGMDHIEPHSFHLVGRDEFSKMKSAGSYFKPGDVLYGRLRPYLNKVHKARFEGVASAEFIVLPASENHNGDFIKYLLHQQQFIDFAMSRASGDRPRVKFDVIADFCFGLPPYDEQGRIVDKIESLFAQLDHGEAALRDVQKLLARYRQSVLKAAVTGQLTADWRSQRGASNWKMIMLGELAEYLTSGSRGWAKYYSEKGDLFIRAQNLKNDQLELDDIAYVTLPSISEGQRTRVRKGDLLITITGANVTKSALVEKDPGTAYVSQHVALFRPTREIDPEFLYWFVVAKAGGRKQLENYAYGAGKPGLNLQNIREVSLSLPPLEEQREIVQRIKASTSRKEAVFKEIKHQLQGSAGLRQSILKDAFAGKLVPQDPDDEPASELLARIRAERDAATPKKRTRKKVTA